MLSPESPPFYAAPLWPVESNTQGDLVHNAKQQVMDVLGSPIPRLYAAGEISSIFGHLYLQSTNNSECLIAGRLAARHVSQESPGES